MQDIIVINICQQNSDTIYNNDKHLLECRDDMSIDSGSISASDSESSQETNNIGAIDLEKDLDDFVDTLDRTKTKKSRLADEDIL